MKITPVKDMLAPKGLDVPILNVLIPNKDNYKTLLLQPSGEIEANAEGVHHKDRDLAKKQFALFLDDAKHTQADLVITPEYSMPWSVLINAIKSDLVPAYGHPMSGYRPVSAQPTLK